MLPVKNQSIYLGGGNINNPFQSQVDFIVVCTVKDKLGHNHGFWVPGCYVNVQAARQLFVMVSSRFHEICSSQLLGTEIDVTSYKYYLCLTSNIPLALFDKDQLFIEVQSDVFDNLEATAFASQWEAKNQLLKATNRMKLFSSALEREARVREAQNLLFHYQNRYHKGDL